MSCFRMMALVRLFALLMLCKATVPLAAFAADSDEPKTLAEAWSRLQRVLGEYSPEEQHEWVLPTEFEHRNQLADSKQETLMVFKGQMIVSHPFHGADSISFDEVWQWKRQVFDVTSEGQRTLTRAQRSHNVTRYTIARRGDQWLATGLMLSNGIHNSIDGPTFTGVVRWSKDGFGLQGCMSPDRFYGSGGSLVAGVAYGESTYSISDGCLTIARKFQPYELSTAPSGLPLVSPNFAKPLGKPFDLLYKSEKP
jgi:hypothetical protein